ncbi:MAG: hypothetical protein J6Y99_10680 [Bacteroidales bacterium]|nr:hypothetical protein [Bacteroidales bacterium]
MDINTIFDGWGTELLSILIGLILVGTGCHYYKNGKIKQKQMAGNNATQKQEARSTKGKKVSQDQDAGDNANQSQIG